LRGTPLRVALIFLLLASLAGCRESPLPGVFSSPAAARGTSTPVITDQAAARPSVSLSPTPTPATHDASRTAAKVQLPQDDAAHPAGIEWWYFNGHLEAEDRSRYGFHFVFFKVRVGDVYVLLGQLALTDHQQSAFVYDQRLGGETLQPQRGFEAAIGDWRMSGFGGEFRLRGSAQGRAFDLQTMSTKGPALHGDGGIVDFVVAGSSAYYSYPRLGLSGTVSDQGVTKPVAGLAWMDHQWGDLQTQMIGWDWFSLQLDDGTDVMLSVVRDREGQVVLRYGTVVDGHGVSRPVTSGEFVVVPLETWRSPRTGIEYPSKWELSMPSLGLSVVITPVLRNAEFAAADRNVPAYWEGEVTVVGVERGAPMSGLGFVELVGYGE